MARPASVSQSFSGAVKSWAVYRPIGNDVPLIMHLFFVPLRGLRMVKDMWTRKKSKDFQNLVFGCDSGGIGCTELQGLKIFCKDIQS